MAAQDIHVVWDDAAIGFLGLDRQVAAVVDRIAAEALQTMKRITPVSPVGSGHRSGNLRSSCHAFRQPDGDVIVGYTADYAPYVNDDTRPHIIRSHGNYPLRNRETNQVFGREVHHPGTRGQHMIERTAETLDGRVFRA